MSLVDHYRNQLAWRDWESAMRALPDLDGACVLDLGCGVGDQAALLAARGASVVGIDGNETVIEAAKGRAIARAEFVVGDVVVLPPLPSPRPFDGIWASFTAAYFCDLVPVLAAWRQHLRPGGWIALVEIDDMFAHEPIAARTCELLGSYVDEALAARRYDFRMGRKLAANLTAAGFANVTSRDLADKEFAFAGPASPDVVRAWRERFELMRLLRARFGAEYESVRDDFLACLGRPDHRAVARVVQCIAQRPAN